MPTNKKTHTWYNRPILSQDHIPELERQAALLEFGHGLPRSEAEDAAYRAYTGEHHKNGAAHHLRGLRAAQASGDFDEAHKHGVAYSLHMERLGYDPMDRVPDEIKELAEGDGKGKQYRFKSHQADHFLIQQ